MNKGGGSDTSQLPALQRGDWHRFYLVVPLENYLEAWYTGWHRVTNLLGGLMVTASHLASVSLEKGLA